MKSTGTLVAAPRYGGPAVPQRLAGRLPWRKNWPRTPGAVASHKPDVRWSHYGRQQARREAAVNATIALTKRFGGESRHALRAMGRALGKRELRQQREATCRQSG